MVATTAPFRDICTVEVGLVPYVRANSPQVPAVGSGEDEPPRVLLPKR